MRCGAKPSADDVAAEARDVEVLTRWQLKEELKEQLSGLQERLLEEVQKSLQEIGSGRASPLTIGQPERKTLPGPRPHKTLVVRSSSEQELTELAKKGLRQGNVVRVQNEMGAQVARMSRDPLRSREEKQSNDSDAEGSSHHELLLPVRPPIETPPMENSDEGEEDLLQAPQVSSRPDARQICCMHADIDGERSPGDCLWRVLLRAIVDSDTFAYIVTGLVVVNAALIGFETDYSARHGGSEKMPGSEAAGKLFCYIFTAEVLCRMISYGLFEFLCGQEWKWNVFDFTVVGLQWVDEAVDAVTGGHGHGGMNLGFLRILRTLRVARIMRLARVLHLVVELRTMVSSILASLKPLAWASVLFSMLIYAVAVAMTQMANEYRAKNQDHPDAHLETYFCNLGTAILALWECISGGMDWQNMAQPLIDDVSPWMGVVFSGYVAFSMLAMMNVITGIFVDNATTYAQQDKDMYVVKHVLNLFKKSELNADGAITFKVFSAKLDTRELQQLFAAVDVDVADAQSLFRLIDTDENGTVTPDELMRGWIRLRGPAKALDLSLLIQETARAFDSQRRRIDGVCRSVDWICKSLEVALTEEKAELEAAPILTSGMSRTTRQRGNEEPLSPHGMRPYEANRRPSLRGGASDADYDSDVGRALRNAFPRLSRVEPKYQPLPQGE